MEVVRGKFQFFDSHELLHSLDIESDSEIVLPALLNDSNRLQVLLSEVEINKVAPGLDKLITQTVLIEEVPHYVVLDSVDGIFTNEVNQ